MILFLHDTSLSLLRGAELTIKQLLAFGAGIGFDVQDHLPEEAQETFSKIASAQLIVVCSTSRCGFEAQLLQHLITSGKPYIKIEFDYNFCARRTLLCTVDPEVQNCCDTQKFHLYRELFAKARLCVFQSPKHYREHEQFYGKAVSRNLIMPPTVDVDALQVCEVKSDAEIPFFGDLTFIKGGSNLVDYANQHPNQQFVVYGKNALPNAVPANIAFRDMLPNPQVLEVLGRSKYVFCRPHWPEPSGRLAAEAFLSGCEIIGNDRIGTFSFDFYPQDPQRAQREMKETIGIFWQKLQEILQTTADLETGLGRVLVTKTSGGLGDYFFCLPALYALRDVSDTVTFGVAARLVSFFREHLQGISVVSEEAAQASKSSFDQFIELGNYPAYLNGFKLPHAIAYTAHNRVRQHATAHYLDAVARLHRGVKHRPFPYFQRVASAQPYYTVHAGAGMLRKAWAAENFKQLILQLHKDFPTLHCHIIIGPDDPNPFEGNSPNFVHTITGDLQQVGNAMAGALFHIGNDSGITHLAGAFNLPSVGIYGPTGPGAWGSVSENFEMVWGKPGSCDLVCNYNVLQHCENRVCLSSISPAQVLAKVYVLLDGVFVDGSSSYRINPVLHISHQAHGCQLNYGQQEFEIHFTDDAIREKVTQILAANFQSVHDEDMQDFVNFLMEQKFLLRLPSFGHKKTTPKRGYNLNLKNDTF